jgi:hypothetical protein
LHWIEIAHPSGGVDWPANTRTWLCWKDDATINYANEQDPAAPPGTAEVVGDFNPNVGRHNNTITSGPATAFPSTYPAGGTFNNQYWYMINVSYTTEDTETNCSDGLDNDSDGYTDCLDSNCDSFSELITCGVGVCSNTGELTCSGGSEINTCQPGLPAENQEVTCNDELDNDCDGFTDCADSDCTLGADCCGTVVIEGEEMGYHANGTVDGDYWLLWANGAMREEVSFPDAGAYRFEVIAKGDLAYDIGPQMGLLIDGVLVDDTVFVDTTTPETFVFEAEISAGRHTIAIRFYNDLWIPDVIDRNLYVDKIVISLLSCAAI